MYEEHLKSGIPLLFPELVVDILHFGNILGQIHHLFSRQLVGFMIIYPAFGISTCMSLFQRHFRVQAVETNSG